MWQVPSNFSNLVVTLFKEDNNYSTNATITDDIKSIPLFTDTGTGEVNMATIIVRSLDGKYNTSGAIKFAEFDRIRIQCDDLGGKSYDRYFEIISIIPSQTKGEGTLLTLECVGIEYHVQHIHMVKPYYFEDSYTTAKSICDIYNTNNGSRQPDITGHNLIFGTHSGVEYGNGLPFYNANNWEFGLNEDTCYNRLMDLVENAGGAVSAGGALTFFELGFDTTGVNAVNIRLRDSGSNTTLVQVKNAVATGVKVGEQEGMIANPTGTNVLAWGSSEHGTLPVDHSKYESHLLQFIFRPEWSNGIDYKTDAKVRVISTVSGESVSKHYKATQDHTSSTGTNKPGSGSSWSSYWSQIDMSDEFGDNVQYSPWTDDKATLWKYNCDPSGSTFTNGGWFDINTVIHDDTFFRTWADVRLNNWCDDPCTRTDDEKLDAIAVKYSYDGNKTGLPRGFRILVDDTNPTGDLEDFPNMVVEYQPTNSVGTKKWRKLYSFVGQDSSNNFIQNKVQVAILDEAKVFTDTIVAVDDHTWSDISSGDYGNDCFHQYTTAPTNVDGVDLIGDTTRSEITDDDKYPDITKDGSEFTQNQQSAIEFKAVGANIAQTAFEGNGSPTSAFYTNTIGFNFRIPFPCYDDGASGITEEVGDMYGGGQVTSGSGDTRQEPATLDIQNSNYSSNGLEGFNHEQSEDYGQISAVAFWLKYSMISGNELDDEHRFRAFFIDTKDNVVYSDFVVNFSNLWQEIRLPISSFRIYRGRRPIYGFSVVTSSIIPPKELEVINIFEWRNVKIFGVQYQATYDKYGRYNPGNGVFDTAGVDSVSWSEIAGATRSLKMDGFRFIKPLLVTSGTQSVRNLEPMFQQFPGVSMYHQLQNIAKSHLEIEKFKHKEFNIESTGDDIFDVRFGEAFYLNNEDIVSDDDKSGEDNNIKLVAKRIEYSITKPAGGRGGLRRKLKGVKVFE